MNPILDSLKYFAPLGFNYHKISMSIIESESRPPLLFFRCFTPPISVFDDENLRP